MIKPKKAPYSGTQKDPDGTISDINKMLRAYGIDSYRWTTLWEKNSVELTFVVESEPGKNLTIRVTPPVLLVSRRIYDEKTRRTSKKEIPDWHRSLRLMYWWMKAKIEAIAYGLREVEEEFLSDIVVRLPSGEETTVGKAIRPALAAGSNSVIDIPQLTGESE
jgi:hypothetical protein